MTVVEIRRATVNDLPELYRVALKTGDSGNDATGMFRNDEMLGEVFVGPYVTHANATSNLVSKAGETVGYGLCVIDTLVFQDECRENWWPALQEKYAALQVFCKEDWLVSEIFHPTPSPDEILNDYPSHGHIDLLPIIQGQGHGRRIMTHMEEQLKGSGSVGFHLRVSVHNDRGLKFYAALGYKEVMRRGDEVIVGKRFSQ